MTIEAMKLALEFIEATNKSSSFWLVPESNLNKTATALRTAIEQAEKQEPVGYADQIDFDEAMRLGKGCDVWPVKGDYEHRTGRKLRPLYTTPPAAPVQEKNNG